MTLVGDRDFLLCVLADILIYNWRIMAHAKLIKSEMTLSFLNRSQIVVVSDYGNPKLRLLTVAWLTRSVAIDV